MSKKKEEYNLIDIPCPRASCDYCTMINLNDFQDTEDRRVHIRHTMKNAIRKLIHEHEKGEHTYNICHPVACSNCHYIHTCSCCCRGKL